MVHENDLSIGDIVECGEGRRFFASRLVQIIEINIVNGKSIFSMVDRFGKIYQYGIFNITKQITNQYTVGSIVVSKNKDKLYLITEIFRDKYVFRIVFHIVENNEMKNLPIILTRHDSYLFTKENRIMFIG
jgi:hypothetical protein